MTSPLAALILAASLASTVGVADPMPGGRQPGTAPGGGGGGGGGPNGKNPPEPKTISLTPAQVFADAREALRSSPLAERLTVAVAQKGRSPLSAALLLRTAPGKEHDQRDAKVSIEAGDLRIYAADGQLTAITASNPTTYFRAEIDGPPTVTAVSKALHVLPLPELAIFFSDGVVTDPTPLTRGIVWQPVSVAVNDVAPPITLTGAIDGKPGPSIAFEHQTVQRNKQKETLLRVRSFTCPLAAPAGDERTLTIASAWTEPGDPATWVIDIAGRTRVDSLAALGLKVDPPALPPATKPDDPAPKADPAPPAKPEATPPAKPDAPKSE